MTKIELKDVTKVYDGKIKAVNKVSFSVEDSEFVVLAGPSGCGKTTILRMIAGLEEITFGELLLGGKVINKIPPKDRDVAMVFQNYALYPHLNVHGNMAFGLKLRKYNKNEIDKRIDEAAEILEIKDLLERRPQQLSGGQKQRVAIGRAIVRKPKLFLFDEPLSNLDTQLRTTMRIELDLLHKRLNTPMIYVTHDQVEAMTLGEKIVILKNGELQQIGNSVEIYQRPNNKFVASFFGSPPMNFIEGIIEKKGNEFIFESSDNSITTTLGDNYNLKMNDKNKIFAFIGNRPEDIRIHDLNSLEGFESSVDLIENLGSDKIIHISTGRINIRARVSNRNDIQENQKIKYSFRVGSLHLFDNIKQNYL